MSSHLQLPDGVALRPADSADADAMAELMNAAEAPLGGDADSSAEDVRHHWNRTADNKTWLAERDEMLVGSLETFAHEEGYLIADLYVHPELQATTLAASLVEVSENDARSRGLASIRNAVLENDATATALLEREGYAPVRHFYRMIRELDGDLPQPEWPAGFELVPFELERDIDAVHAAIEEAFENEWAHVPETDEAFRERTPKRGGYAPELWVVVRDGDEVAAVTMNDAKRYGMGWIATVAVRRAWRKRGLGLAMLYESFRRFRERGETVVGLGVDAQNSTGATRLYERAGMRRAWAATVYEKELT
ncbi:MAG: mycothiol synthase [Gaiellaceae bacterium]|nr:mycothiol synthase [Gaiellaceae bacterium]